MPRSTGRSTTTTTRRSLQPGTKSRPQFGAASRPPGGWRTTSASPTFARPPKRSRRSRRGDGSSSVAWRRRRLPRPRPLARKSGRAATLAATPTGTTAPLPRSATKQRRAARGKPTPGPRRPPARARATSRRRQCWVAEHSPRGHVAHPRASVRASAGRRRAPTAVSRARGRGRGRARGRRLRRSHSGLRRPSLTWRGSSSSTCGGALQPSKPSVITSRGRRSGRRGSRRSSLVMSSRAIRASSKATRG
mmetsp:Transcript_15962/g.41964  ORF Transcript_15962/g.41964 Transcript_15962/m.41964 type:complete len:249 (-) Transcript_15962:676-1422(-)